MNASTPSGKVHAGGCHCGEVRYEVHGKLHDTKMCHCKLCRKLHGHVSSYARVEKDALHLIREEGLRWYRLSDQSDRGFCKECGSSLFWRPVRSQEVAITPGTLDGASGISTSAQMFCKDKGDYYPIDPAIPAYNGDDEA
ncbi:GFA family protein [Thalassospiraceae bacterium SW-3-3]|nr:GFA family protein [Thalassospiraceae bacterium SW-3-3]